MSVKFDELKMDKFDEIIDKFVHGMMTIRLH